MGIRENKTPRPVCDVGFRCHVDPQELGDQKNRSPSLTDPFDAESRLTEGYRVTRRVSARCSFGMAATGERVDSIVMVKGVVNERNELERAENVLQYH